MSVALLSIDGIESAEVSLEEGVAAVVFASEHEVTIEQVRQVIRDNGFSPKEAVVRVVGQVTRAAAGEPLRLTVRGQSGDFELREHADEPDALARLLESALPGEITIEGVVPEAEAGTPTRVLLVRDVVDRSDSRS